MFHHRTSFIKLSAIYLAISCCLVLPLLMSDRGHMAEAASVPAVPVQQSTSSDNVPVANDINVSSEIIGNNQDSYYSDEDYSDGDGEEDGYYYEEGSTVIDEVTMEDLMSDTTDSEEVDVIEITQKSTSSNNNDDGQTSLVRSVSKSLPSELLLASSEEDEDGGDVTVIYYYEETIERSPIALDTEQPFMFQLSYSTISFGLLVLLLFSFVFAKLFEESEDFSDTDYKDLEKQVIHHQHKQLEAMMKMLQFNNNTTVGSDEKLPEYHPASNSQSSA